jgi:Raf kinase inhibitor-like YbhB/YbcL family protein
MTLELTSPAFADGDPIPEGHGRRARDVNPPLTIRGVPMGTETLALVIDDPDAEAPTGKVWVHWLVWNIPTDVEEIPEGWDARGAREGQNDFGETGYGGPAPPDRQHMYRFRLYALDTMLALAPGATKGELEAAMAGHVLAEATLRGTYAP